MHHPETLEGKATVIRSNYTLYFFPSIQSNNGCPSQYWEAIHTENSRWKTCRWRTAKLKGKKGLEKATGICRIHTNINSPNCFWNNYYCSRRYTNILFLFLKTKFTCIIHVNKSVSIDQDRTPNKPLSIPEHTPNYRYKNISLALIWMADSAHKYAYLIALIQILK